MAGFPPKKNTAFTFWTALTLQSNTKVFKAGPTLAAGDVKVSIDGGAFNNLGTLPDAEPDASASIRVQLTAAEMNGDMIVVQFIDASGAEWCDQLIVIQTAAAQVGDDPSATTIADAVWDEAATGHTDAGKAGEQLWTDIEAILADTGTDGVIVGSASLSAIAAAVWDAVTSGLTAVGSIGKLLLAKAGLITSGVVTVSSPVASGGTNVTTYQGDDYDTADSRQIEWTVSTAATLTGGTVAVIVDRVATYTGAIISETSVTLDLTAAQTAAIPAGKYKYQVVATQGAGNGSDVITLVDGTWISAARVSS